jgi:hypothetical protein
MIFSSPSTRTARPPLSISSRPKRRISARGALPLRRRMARRRACSSLEADHAIHRLAACGQHQDRHVAHAAQPAAEIEPVGVGQHEIEDHRVEALTLQQRLALSRRAGCRQTKARPAEIVGDHPGEAAVVVDHQDALGHEPSIGPGQPRCHWRQ